MLMRSLQVLRHFHPWKLKIKRSIPDVNRLRRKLKRWQSINIKEKCVNKQKYTVKNKKNKSFNLGLHSHLKENVERHLQHFFLFQNMTKHNLNRGKLLVRNSKPVNTVNEFLRQANEFVKSITLISFLIQKLPNIFSP